MVYIKLFVDYLDAIEPLGDAERGRLFTALLSYARTGEEPQLCGNERFIYPMMRAQLDRDAAAQEELSATRSRASKCKQKQQLISNAPFGINCIQDKEEDKEEDKDKEKEKDKSSSKSLTRFVPPTPADVEAYCAEKGYRLDAGYFVDYYTARGWKIKGQPMKDWRAAVRTWIHRDGQTNSPLTPSTATADETRRMQAMLRHLQEA